MSLWVVEVAIVEMISGEGDAILFHDEGRERVELRSDFDPGTVHPAIDINEDSQGMNEMSAVSREIAHGLRVIDDRRNSHLGIAFHRLDQACDIRSDCLHRQEDILCSDLCRHFQLGQRGGLELGDPGFTLEPNNLCHFVCLEMRS